MEERDTTAAAAALVVRDDTQKSHGQVIGAVSRSSDKVVANDSGESTYVCFLCTSYAHHVHPSLVSLSNHYRDTVE